jgi:hypothetical protein
MLQSMYHENGSKKTTLKTNARYPQNIYVAFGI